MMRIHRNGNDIARLVRTRSIKEKMEMRKIHTWRASELGVVATARRAVRVNRKLSMRSHVKYYQKTR